MSAQQTLLAQTVLAARQAQQYMLMAERFANETADKAPIDSPIFTGTPQAPTPSTNDNSTKLATTAYLDRLLAQPSGIATLDNTGKIPTAQIPPFSVTAVYVVASEAAMLALAAGAGAFAIRTDQSNTVYILTQTPASTLGNWTAIGTAPVLSVAGLTGAISSSDLLTALAAAPTNNPTFTGTAQAPTVAGTSDNTQKIATTAFVQAVAALLAPKANPTLTGTPIAPTATVDTNTGQIASTAFVLGQASNANPVQAGTAGPGASTRSSRSDHVHPTDTSRAPLDSPNLTGSPTAPTPAAGDSSTLLATTAFVQSNGVPSGVVVFTILSAAPTGWLMFADQTIGSATSGATYANALAQTIFTALYNNASDANCPVLTSIGGATTRGAQGSAATAWGNNVRMTMPKTLGRALAVAGSGAGLSARAMAQAIGAETITLDSTMQASMAVAGSFSGSGSGTVPLTDGSGGGSPIPSSSASAQTGSVAIGVSVSGSISGTATGGGLPHPNVQPTTFLNAMVKL